MNSKLATYQYAWGYFGSYIGRYSFYDSALIATGFYDTMWLLEYEYTLTGYELDVPVYEEVLDRSLAVYLVPQMRSDGKLKPAVIIDDYPYDRQGYLELTYRGIVDKSNSIWKTLGQYY